MSESGGLGDAVRSGRDALLALMFIVVLAPVMLLIAIAIRLDSGAPVLFGQKRVGWHGREFRMLKFRTLRLDAPEEGVTPEGAASVTRIGRLLRRYRIDELPQFFNVLGGRLALVGPRSEQEADLGELDADIRMRLLSIKPGVTGPAQLEFIAEDALLASCDDPTAVYRRVLIPAKADLNIREFESRSVLKELRWLLQTPVVLISGQARQRSVDRLRRLLRGRQCQS
jgi:lipopolysaccharide/colanic/teichoic acid biosynthesis glycosyltransferase